jgi:tetratricopeptide (TPR) repeat protein
MTRLQIILLISASALVLGLYSLPKVVVDNEESAGGRAIENIQEVDSPGGISAMGHSLNPTEAELADISELRKEISTGTDKMAVANASKELSAIYKKFNRFDSAAFFANQALLNEPSAENIREAGMLYFEAYRFSVDPAKSIANSEKAQELLQRTLEANPSDLEVKTRLGLTFVGGPQPMQGILMIREVLEVEPENEFALFNMGLLSIESRQFARAVEYFEKLANAHPENDEGKFYLGISYMEAGSKDKALSTLNQLRETVKDADLRSAINQYLEGIK